MNYYHIWANTKDGVDPVTFADRMKIFLDQLVSMKKMNSYKITRMKLGFRSMDLPEYHIIMEFETMQQLDDAMTAIIEDRDNIEESHVGFNNMVDADTIEHALYRDFPDVK